MDSVGDGPTKRRAALGRRFWLEEKLGEDASGELHRAIDLRSGTATVVRIVHGHGAARRERLLRETKRAAQVKHPGLAIVLGVGQTEEGDIFVAAESIAGHRLSERLRAGERFDESEAVEIATQISHALAAAHGADVVHRELRPSLVVLTYAGDTTIVKVEGLGVPRAPSASDADPELAYSAPEQRRGEPVGRRADVYSIGAMLYAMLTGVPPGEGSPPVQGALGDVVKRCLAEDAKDRFADTNALSAAMKITVESLPPLAPQATPEVTPEVDGDHSPGGGDEERDSASSPILAPPPASVRPPAAPPERALGRPLTAQPRWKERVVDLAGGPAPRIAIVVVVMFVVGRILTSTTAAIVAALAAGLAFYATWRRTHQEPRDP